MLPRIGALPKFEGDDSKTFGPVAAAPFGSSLILPISYAYIAMMGSDGLTEVRLMPSMGDTANKILNDDGPGGPR